MSKTFTIFAFLAAGVLAVWYFFIRGKTSQPKNTGAVLTTGTAGAVSQLYTGWKGFTSASLQNQTATVNNTFGLLNSVSNLFGLNDGGNSGGVSVGGSAAGGIASSGSGAGPALSSIGNVSSLFDTGFNQGDYSLSPLNNFDVLSASNSPASNNSVDTGVYGFDNTDLNF